MNRSMENNMLPVNEIFETIQGEAKFTGTASVFVRLQGCPVGCPWCDTKHTWDFEGEQVHDIIAKTEDSDTYQSFTESHLASVLGNYQAKHIVITGGEPCLYDLTSFTALLLSNGYTVQVETSGTSEIKVSRGTWVTVSPKYGMNVPVRPDALKRADEIKMPIGKARDLELINDVREHTNAQVWLQPLSQNQKATNICIKACIEHGYRLSIQTHKFIGVR